MLRLLVPFLLLFALPLQAGGGRLTGTATGLDGIYTGQIVISDHPHHVLIGHVIVVRDDSHVARALVINHRRDGVHRLRYDAAWRDGSRLAYRSQTGPGCTHGHCRDNAVGMIVMDAADFGHALRHGLAARLTGPSGAIDIAVPPDLFRDAAGLVGGP